MDPKTTDCLLDRYNQDEHRVAPRIIGLTLVGLLSVVGLLWLALNAIDELAERTQQDWLRIALHAEVTKQNQTLLEYSFWDEAHENLVESVDEVWGNDNIGAFLTDTYGTDLTVALSGDRHPTLAFVSGELTQLKKASPILLPLSGLIAQALEDEEQDHLAHGFLRLGDELYLASAAAFLDEAEETPAGDDSALVFAQQIDGPWLEEIGETYNIRGLRLSGRMTSTCSEAVTGLSDEILGYLCWQRASPGRDYRNVLILSVALIFTTMGLVTWRILRLDRANLRRHTDQLCELASKDFLTDISNRRDFYFLAGRELNRARREQETLSLLMLDIDFFKKINDTYGHSHGDLVLRDFAGITQEQLRGFDIFARLGGEEFAILLPNCGGDEAHDLGERVRNVIANKGFILNSGQEVSITVSIGIAVWNRKDGLDALIKEADEALYGAKQAGRNRVLTSAN